MVTKKAAAGQAKGKKLKLKKETIKDLESKKSSRVKGGVRPKETGDFCSIGCTVTCLLCRPTR